MTDRELEDRVRLALLDAAERDFAAELSDPSPVPVSRRLRRKMAAMLADPDAWLRRKTRPAWKRAGRTAASFFLVCSLTFGTLMAASPTIRAAVARWVTEWYETYVVYRFDGDQTPGALPRYAIGELPEGYAVTGEVVEFPGSMWIEYQNEAGQYLTLDYMRIEEGGLADIDTEDMIVENVTVNSCPGQVFLSQNPEISSAVVWMDEERNMQFTVDGFFKKEDILHIAESVYLEELPN